MANELIVKDNRGFTVRDAEAQTTEAGRCNAARPAETATPTLAESGIFAKLNTDFGDSITSVLREMQERDIREGKVTVSLDISAQVGNGNIEPKFEYKVTRALVCKSECRGEVAPDGQMCWDEKGQCYRYVKKVEQQTDLFDAEDEPEAAEQESAKEAEPTPKPSNAPTYDEKRLFVDFVLDQSDGDMKRLIEACESLNGAKFANEIKEILGGNCRAGGSLEGHLVRWYEATPKYLSLSTLANDNKIDFEVTRKWAQMASLVRELYDSGELKVVGGSDGD